MSEKFSGYFRLVEACGQSGCPVCRSVRDESRGHLAALLHEHVTDPDTRRAFRNSWGFCNWHTWMLLEVENSLFGASILCEDLVGQAIRRLEQREDRPRPSRFWSWLAGIGGRRSRPAIVERYEGRPACSLCVNAAETERQYLLTLVTFVEDGDLQAAYSAADAICLPHLVRAVELTAGTREVRLLVDRTREKWAKVRKDLASFIEKHDYRNREAYTGVDAVSYIRAFEIVAGAKSVFGNDLAAGRDGTRGRSSSAAAEPDGARQPELDAAARPPQHGRAS